MQHLFKSLLGVGLLLAGGADLLRAATPGPYVVVLGIAQDGGYPHAGCNRSCCQDAFANPARGRHVSSLAIVDPESGERWIIDCTPDFRFQLKDLGRLQPARKGRPPLDGILLTHAHIGHYSGLVHLGREVMGTRNVPVFAMPRMAEFLRSQGPWSQLVSLGNIQLRPLEAEKPIALNERITVTPILVPHRDEFSETVGFQVQGPRRQVLFIPDIDKWERWDRQIEKIVVQSDRAYLDGTFFTTDELPGREISEIPHPFIIESIRRFAVLPDQQREKIRFIHLNHTNPALERGSAARKQVNRAGMAVARQGEKFPL
ncbi:MAG: MBL fold metallo-hydrolase [Planctomycetota bacterium]|nr:MBL fold metallo-hydrolase [Planctomycetota bacterium]